MNEIPFLTFVIGAGGSIPYGFPSWGELNSRLQDKEIKHILKKARLPDEMAPTDKDIEQFQKLLSKSTESIDELLMKDENERFRSIGKRGIAHIISLCEDEHDLFRIRSEYKGRWYGKFFDKLFRETSVDLILDLIRNVRIVSFNYDRSMEMYLWTKLKNFGFREDHISCAISTCFCHPNEMLGNYPWAWENAIQYGGETYSEHLRLIDNKAWRPFRTFGESTHTYFLGFGFHEANMGRIGLGERKFISNPYQEDERLKSIQFGGTCKNLSLDLVAKWSGIGFELKDMDILSYLDAIEFPSFNQRRASFSNYAHASLSNRMW